MPQVKRTLFDLIQLGLEQLPDLGQLVSFQDWLNARLLNEEERWFVVRSFSSARPAINATGVANVYRVGDLNVISTDNEPLATIYDKLAVDDFCPKSSESTSEFLSSRKVNLGIFKGGQGERARDAGFTESMASPSPHFRPRWKLSHILPAKGDLGNVEFKSLRDCLVARTARTLSPLNCFPTLHPRKCEFCNHRLRSQPLRHNDYGENYEVYFLAALSKLLVTAGAQQTLKNMIQLAAAEKRFVDTVVEHAALIEQSKNVVIIGDDSQREHRQQPSGTPEGGNTNAAVRLRGQTRLLFEKQALEGLSEGTWIVFRIDNDGTKSDPRSIHGDFVCTKADVREFFNWNLDKDWNQNGRHSWSRFPKWAEEYFRGTID